MAARDLTDHQILVFWGYDELIAECARCDRNAMEFGREPLSLAQVGAMFRADHECGEAYRTADTADGTLNEHPQQQETP